MSAPQNEEEDASQLKFGKDFQNCRCMLISEVNVIMDFRHQQKLKESEEEGISPLFLKTLAYVQRFNKYSAGVLQDVRKLLETKGLEQWELASIGNLNPETAEVAKTLIPSLQNRNLADDDINVLLADLSGFRKFT
mmetsp:Transcript_24774/g.42706  ORF Transcript_24774/g.42706 Transcript_24774/m.42706 type:complete len:136 (+) Transcript_24774:44-451(+)